MSLLGGRKPCDPFTGPGPLRADKCLAQCPLCQSVLFLPIIQVSPQRSIREQNNEGTVCPQMTRRHPALPQCSPVALSNNYLATSPQSPRKGWGGGGGIERPSASHSCHLNLLLFQGPDGLPVPGCWHKVPCGKGSQGWAWRSWDERVRETERTHGGPGAIMKRFESLHHCLTQ